MFQVRPKQHEKLKHSRLTVWIWTMTIYPLWVLGLCGFFMVFPPSSSIKAIWTRVTVIVQATLRQAFEVLSMMLWWMWIHVIGCRSHIFDGWLIQGGAPVRNCVKSWFISTISLGLMNGGYIELVIGIVNQLITGMNHQVGYVLIEMFRYGSTKGCVC